MTNTGRNPRNARPRRRRRRDRSTHTFSGHDDKIGLLIMAGLTCIIVAVVIQLFTN